jgi:hypothetical protein
MTRRDTDTTGGETITPEVSETLSTTTMRTMRSYFDQQNHFPSVPHWAALKDIAETLESMAEERADAVVYLSAIDPGVGKTQAVAHFARALVADPARCDVGMIVCVGRIAEAKAFAAGLGVDRKNFAVLTSDITANELGSEDATTAQILITTQQRIERLCQGRGFGEVAAFHYKGRPRLVRAWDEAWLPGLPLTLSYVDIFEVLKPIQRRCKAMEEGLLAFALDLRERTEGELMDVPDFVNGFGVSLFDIVESVTLKEDQRQTLNAIRIMSGRAARVTREDHFGATALTYHDTLPDDLSPLLVLDASARVRHVYKFVEKHRQGVRRLKEAVKRYDPLKVSLWKTSGGKTSFSERGDELVKGIVKTILTKPDERWLIVAHKKSGRSPDIEMKLKLTRFGGAPQAFAGGFIDAPHSSALLA